MVVELGDPLVIRRDERRHVSSREHRGSMPAYRIPPDPPARILPAMARRGNDEPRLSEHRLGIRSGWGSSGRLHDGCTPEPSAVGAECGWSRPTASPFVGPPLKQRRNGCARFQVLSRSHLRCLTRPHMINVGIVGWPFRIADSDPGLRHDLATKQPALAQVPATVDLAPPANRLQGSTLPETKVFGSGSVGTAFIILWPIAGKPCRLSKSRVLGQWKKVSSSSRPARHLSSQAEGLPASSRGSSAATSPVAESKISRTAKAVPATAAPRVSSRKSPAELRRCWARIARVKRPETQSPGHVTRSMDAGRRTIF